MRNKNYRNKKWLYKQYLKEKKSIPQIAKLCSCSFNTIWFWLKKYDVKIRSISKAKKGKLCSKANPFYGKKHSKEARLKISIAASKRIGSKNPFYGRKHSEEFIKKLKLRKGKLHPCYGIKRSDLSERNKKLKGELNPAKRIDVRRKMSESRIGKKLSEKTKRKLSILNRLENNANWRGGISFEPYDLMFNKHTKNIVNKRDAFICQLCGTNILNTKNITTHHIDYDKKNSSLYNLITLCKGCNSKVNFNRLYWTKYFKNKFGKGY